MNIYGCFCEYFSSVNKKQRIILAAKYLKFKSKSLLNFSLETFQSIVCDAKWVPDPTIDRVETTRQKYNKEKPPKIKKKIKSTFLVF